MIGDLKLTTIWKFSRRAIALIILGWIFSYPHPTIGSELASTSPGLKINEIYYDHPRSDDGHEWVELANVGPEVVEINTQADSNWRFFDGKNHRLVSENSISLSPGQLVIITQNPAQFVTDYPNYQGLLIKSAIKLTNSSETLKLSRDKGETYFEEVAYSSSTGANGNGKSLERDDQGWYESSLEGGTPGQLNSPRPVNETPKQESTLPTSQARDETSAVIDLLPIESVKGLPNGTMVKTTGFVTVPPGLISETSWYIQDETAGIQLYHRHPPTLSLGDRLTVIAKRSQNNGENRLIIPEDQLILAEPGPIVTPKTITVDQISEHLEGQLVQLTSVITIEKGQVWLTDGQSKIELLIRETTAIEKPPWRDNDQLKAVGIISPYRGKLRLLPRSQEDISWEKSESATVFATRQEADQSVSPIENSPKSSNQLPQDTPVSSSSTPSTKPRKRSTDQKSAELGSVLSQVKDLVSEAPNQQPPSKPVLPQPPPTKTLPFNHKMSYTFYGIIVGSLGAYLWQKRSLLSKVPKLLKQWQKNWPQP